MNEVVLGSASRDRKKDSWPALFQFGLLCTSSHLESYPNYKSHFNHFIQSCLLISKCWAAVKRTVVMRLNWGRWDLLIRFSCQNHEWFLWLIQYYSIYHLFMLAPLFCKHCSFIPVVILRVLEAEIPLELFGMSKWQATKWMVAWPDHSFLFLDCSIGEIYNTSLIAQNF